MSMHAVLDIEASGFGRGSYPIELGFVCPDGSAFCSLIKPEPDWCHWDASAEALHGISRDLLAAHGKPVVWMAEQINARLAGQTVYCDGWGQDYAWLGRLFDAAEQQPRFRLQDLRTLLNEEEARRWHAVTQAVRSRECISRHRASSDARVLQLALVEVRLQTLA